VKKEMEKITDFTSTIIDTINDYSVPHTKDMLITIVAETFSDQMIKIMESLKSKEASSLLNNFKKLIDKPNKKKTKSISVNPSISNEQI